LEKRLSLPPAAMHIARRAVLLKLMNVAPHCFPSSDLARIFLAYTATQVVAAIPLKPAPRVISVDPSLFTPN
jgi:hypothetical protein